MEKFECRVNMKVYFGRDGQKSLGQIVKLNPVKAQVRALEQHKTHRAGEIWTVPYRMLTIAPQDAQPGQAVPVVVKEKLKYFPFDPITNHILSAMFNVYNGLSPENLHCDGEISGAEASRRASVLNRQLRGLQIAYGSEVSESEIYEWWESKRTYEKESK